MSADALVDLLQAFDRAGIELWLDGGWAVDAVLGEQTRSHKNVDVILRQLDLARLQELLRGRGYARREGGTESRRSLSGLTALPRESLHARRWRLHPCKGCPSRIDARAVRPQHLFHLPAAAAELSRPFVAISARCQRYRPQPNDGKKNSGSGFARSPPRMT
jgi:hypothetical protein